MSENAESNRLKAILGEPGLESAGDGDELVWVEMREEEIEVAGVVFWYHYRVDCSICEFVCVVN